jgi:hypothetical protein
VSSFFAVGKDIAVLIFRRELKRMVLVPPFGRILKQ